MQLEGIADRVRRSTHRGRILCRPQVVDLPPDFIKFGGQSAHPWFLHGLYEMDAILFSLRPHVVGARAKATRSPAAPPKRNWTEAFNDMLSARPTWLPREGAVDGERSVPALMDSAASAK